ncbi:MAG: hypothetical protein PHT07_14805 [Paludibacter sp.]|nr:hypothetical protein [Paludibacter sp.]
MKTILKLFGTFVLLLSPLFFYIYWGFVVLFAVFLTFASILVFYWIKWIKSKDLFKPLYTYNEAEQPYIISIKTGPEDVEKVEVLKAVSRQFDPTIAGVTFTYPISGISYREFLAHIAAGTGIHIQKIRLSASNQDSKIAITQILETIYLTQWDLNGNSEEKTVIPMLDAYQYSQTLVDIFKSFDIDGLTSFIISKLYADTSLKIYLYPSFPRMKQVWLTWDSIFGFDKKDPIFNAVAVFWAWCGKLIKKRKLVK